MQEDFVEIMHMLVDMGVWFGYVVDPSKLDIVVGFRHLITTHKGHGGTLAILDSRARLPKWLPD